MAAPKQPLRSRPLPAALGRCSWTWSRGTKDPPEARWGWVFSLPVCNASPRHYSAPKVAVRSHPLRLSRRAIQGYRQQVGDPRKTSPHNRRSRLLQGHDRGGPNVAGTSTASSAFSAELRQADPGAPSTGHRPTTSRKSASAEGSAAPTAPDSAPPGLGKNRRPRAIIDAAPSDSGQTSCRLRF
jgi:hypothetical protein